MRTMLSLVERESQIYLLGTRAANAFQIRRRQSMNSRHATVRVLAMTALIFVVAGLSGYPTSAKTPGKVSPTVLRLNGVQPTSARPLTAMLLDDPEAIYEGARI